MADETGTVTPPRASERAAGEVTHGAGWLAFAGTMIGVIGVVNIVYGIAAIDDSSFFVHNTKYILSNLNTWGWVTLIVGVVQVFSAFGIWAGHQAGRWVGILTAALNMIVALLWIPAYPLAALAIFALDILVLYGLLAYGGQHRAAL